MQVLSYTTSILSSYDFRTSVAETTIKEDLTSLALAVTVTRPYYSLMQLGKGLRAYPDLFRGIDEGVILKLFESQ